MNNRKIKNLFATGYLMIILAVLIFSCITFFYKSTAWFASTSDVNAEGMGVSVTVDGSIGIGSISVYKMDEEANTAIFYENPSSSELTNILTLNQYDSVFEENRGNTPIIIKATLENFKNVSQATELMATISLKDSSLYTDTRDNKQILLPYISNLISICCSTDPVFDDTNKIPSEYFPYARDMFSNTPFSSNAQTFVSYTESGRATSIGPVKNDSLTFTITKPAGQTTLDVYIFLCYDENLIARFIMDSQQSTGEIEEPEVYFQWGSEILFEKDIANINFQEVED